MAKKKKTRKYPDGRGKRPTDPNQLAKWLVEQTTQERPVRQSPK